jgi:hypothetical protein
MLQTGTCPTGRHCVNSCTVSTCSSSWSFLRRFTHGGKWGDGRTRKGLIQNLVKIGPTVERRLSLHTPRKHIEVQLHSLVTTALNGEWSASHSDRFTPGKKTRYPSNRRLKGPHSWSSVDEKNFLLVPGFDLATVQPNHKIMPDSARGFRPHPNNTKR